VPDGLILFHGRPLNRRGIRVAAAACEKIAC